MSRKKILLGIAVFLILIGIASIAYEQISYTKQEKVLDVGPLEVTVDREAHCVRLPTVFGILVLVSGIAILLTERNRSF